MYYILTTPEDILNTEFKHGDRIRYNGQRFWVEVVNGFTYFKYRWWFVDKWVWSSVSQRQFEQKRSEAI